jgi:hypothetical protein
MLFVAYAQTLESLGQHPAEMILDVYELFSSLKMLVEDRTFLRYMTDFSRPLQVISHSTDVFRHLASRSSPYHGIDPLSDKLQMPS